MMEHGIRRLDNGGFMVGDLRVPPTAPPRILDHLDDLQRRDKGATFEHRQEFDALKMYGSQEIQDMYLAPLGGEEIRAIRQHPPPPPPHMIRGLYRQLAEHGFSAAAGMIARTGLTHLWVVNRVMTIDSRLRLIGPKMTGPLARDLARGTGYFFYLASNDQRREALQGFMRSRVLTEAYPGLIDDAERATGLLAEVTGMGERFHDVAKWAFAYGMLMQESVTDSNAPGALKAERLRIGEAIGKIARALRAPIGMDHPGLAVVYQTWGRMLTAPRMGIDMDLILLSPFAERIEVHPYFMLSVAEMEPRAMPLFAARAEIEGARAAPPVVYTNDAGDRRVADLIVMPTTGLTQDRPTEMIMDALTSPNRVSRRFPYARALNLNDRFMRLYPELDKHDLRLHLVSDDASMPEDMSGYGKATDIAVQIPERMNRGPANYWKGMMHPVAHNELCQRIMKLAHKALVQAVGAIDAQGGYRSDAIAALDYAPPSPAPEEQFPWT